MAPDSAAPKRKPRENQYIFDLGVRGRKTGLTVEDTGIRDENGLEPMDHLFSSPEKSDRKEYGSRRNADTTISSEEDMDMVESSLPNSTTATERRQRSSMRMPLPHSKSPRKTFLQSPAKRNPSLGPMSSPSKGSIVVPRGPPEPVAVRRRLDFSNENYEQDTADSEVIGRSPQKRGDARTPALRKTGKASKLATVQEPLQDDDDYDEHDDAPQQYYDDEDEPYQNMNGGDDEVDQVESDPELEPPKKPRGKDKPKESAAPEPPAKRGRGRRKQVPDVVEERDESAPPAKRTRHSFDGSNAAANAKPGKAAATKQPKAKATAAIKSKKSKATTKKTNLAPVAENDSPAVQRGPPLPRNNRGLVILRRETPMDSNGFKQTRSGRNSVRPVAYWKNERIEYSDDENEYYNGGKFLLPRIKGVVRADEVDQPRPKKKYKSTKGKKRAATVESEDDDESEPWETEPGRLVGEIRLWDPEDQTGMHTEEMEEEIALSATAIVTRDTAGGSFKFAKTLTMPFFGSGMVDLPPGGMKKPKNSRKMQMVFFVFYGRVEVTVNDSTFRIGKGGMWQVPRGNFYSIANSYNKPARIFFSQGCEVLEDATETAQ